MHSRRKVSRRRGNQSPIATAPKRTNTKGISKGKVTKTVEIVDENPPKACFAYGKRCNRCQKLGHFQSYCRSKPVEELYYENSDSENSSEHGIDMVGSRKPQTNTHEEHAMIRINNKPLTVKLDSGAETNIIPKEEFHRLVPKRQRKQKLKESTAKLTAFGGHDIPVIGKCHLQCRHRGTTHVVWNLSLSIMWTTLMDRKQNNL